MNLSNTDTTRYLCAAAHLSKKFRDSVIEQIVQEEYKAIAVSHGVDLLTVVKHCFVAQKREFIRDSLLALIFLLACVAYFYINVYLVLFVFFPTAVIIFFITEWKARYITVAKGLARSSLNSDSLKFNPNTTEKIKIEKTAIEQNSNVIIYGGFSPFVGSGFDIGGWSFTLNLNKGREEIGRTIKPIEFEVEELYEYVVNAIRDLKLYGLSIEDKLCVNGQEIRSNPVLLPDPFSRPRSQVDSEFVKKFINTTGNHIRYYKHIKVISWNGELIFSVFLRILKINQRLFIETNYFVLTPVKNEYRLVDAIEPKMTLEKVVPLLIGSLWSGVSIWPFSVVFVLEKLDKKLKERKQRKKIKRIIRETPNFNYGAINSVRELASSSEYNQYFQKLDKEMYLKIIQRQLIDSLVEFLEIKNIDISELKERRTAIFNNGVIVSGGSIKATNLSVGEKAKAVFGELVQSNMFKTEALQQDK